MEKRTMKTNGMSVAGFIFGLLCLVTSFMISFVPFLAGLSLCLSILSRGDQKMNWFAKLGIIFTIVGMALALFETYMVIQATPGGLNGVLQWFYSWTDPTNWLGRGWDYSYFYGF